LGNRRKSPRRLVHQTMSAKNHAFLDIPRRQTASTNSVEAF
jgi:hypothetical protein